MNDDRAEMLSALMMAVAVVLMATALLSKSWLLGSTSADLRIGLWSAETCYSECEKTDLKSNVPESETEAASGLRRSSWQIFGIATAAFGAVGMLSLIVAWMKRQPPAQLRDAPSTPSRSRLPLVSAIALLVAIASALGAVLAAPASGFVVGYAFPTFLVAAVAGLTASVAMWPSATRGPAAAG